MAGNHSFYYEAPNYVYNHGHGTADILKCHIVKMKTANLFVSKKKTYYQLVTVMIFRTDVR